MNNQLPPSIKSFFILPKTSNNIKKDVDNILVSQIEQNYQLPLDYPISRNPDTNKKRKCDLISNTIKENEPNKYLCVKRYCSQNPLDLQLVNNHHNQIEPVNLYCNYIYKSIKGKEYHVVGTINSSTGYNCAKYTIDLILEYFKYWADKEITDKPSSISKCLRNLLLFVNSSCLSNSKLLNLNNTSASVCLSVIEKKTKICTSGWIGDVQCIFVDSITNVNKRETIPNNYRLNKDPNIKIIHQKLESSDKIIQCTNGFSQTINFDSKIINSNENILDSIRKFDLTEIAPFICNLYIKK